MEDPECIQRARSNIDLLVRHQHPALNEVLVCARREKQFVILPVGVIDLTVKPAILDENKSRRIAEGAELRARSWRLGFLSCRLERHQADSIRGYLWNGGACGGRR